MPSMPAPPLSETDYDAIEAAVMETVRGRWFLAEHARRNRAADTRTLLTAIERLEGVIRGESAAQPVERIRFGLMDMAKAIAQTKAEIAAIQPTAEHGRIEEATEELDSVVQATETATSDILAAAERIQEIAWTLRETGLAPDACDILDGQATDIYTACSFQDVTGQRTRKVIQVLRYLESRIQAMIEIWGLEPAAGPSIAPARTGEAALLNGPARPGQGLDQADIDMVMGSAAPSRAAAEPQMPPPAAAWAQPEASWAQPQAFAAASLQPRDREPAPDPVAAEAHDPLAPLRALSYEEKIALFS